MCFARAEAYLIQTDAVDVEIGQDGDEGGPKYVSRQ